MRLYEWLDQRVIIVRGEIDDQAANEITAKLLFFDSEDTTRPITLDLESPGGRAVAALAILDTMAAVHAPVHTRCLSQVSGTAALLLASGLHGHRSLAELGVVAMVPLAPGRNPHLTLKMAQETLERLTTAFVEAFTTATGRAPGEIREAMATHHSFMGSTARDFGFVDLLMTDTVSSR